MKIEYLGFLPVIILFMLAFSVFGTLCFRDIVFQASGERHKDANWIVFWLLFQVFVFGGLLWGLSAL